MPLPATYTDNSPTPAPLATVGFKISKPGYDANRAAGSNFVFDSSWPSLPIAFETTITNPITSGPSTATIAHNLGYPPFVMGWAYYTDPAGVTVCRRFMPYANNQNIYLSGDATVAIPFNATKLKLRAFQLDLSRDIDYLLAPGDTFNLPYDPNYGVKVVKPNKDINSKDMRDFAVHSRCQSPLILAVKTQDTAPAVNNGVVQYTNKGKNPVWVYGFIKAGNGLHTSLNVPVNTYIFAPYYSQAYPRTFTDGFTSYLQWVNSGTFSDNGATIVILRDPMFSATPVAVTY